MIISKPSKSYDTADRSERPVGNSVRRAPSVGKSAGQRWGDDGGPVEAPPAAPAPVAAVELTSKPPWSVLSLRDLNEAIRLERWSDNPVRLQHEAEQLERRRLSAVQVEQANAASTARAQQNRYRNPWENT